MISSDRNLFNIIVPQDSKSEFLVVSKLQEAYDKVQEEKGWSIKRIADVMKTENFIERSYYLLKEANKLPESLNTGFIVFKKYVDDNTLNKVLKEFGWWKLTGKGKDRETWCHPYIWVSLALEMNPEIYAKVIIWLTDGLIKARMDCGIKYLPLTQQLKEKIIDQNNDPTVYFNTAIEINKLVFGEHYKDIRNYAVKEKLDKLQEVEVTLTNLLKLGFVKDYPTLIKTIQQFDN